MVKKRILVECLRPDVDQNSVRLVADVDVTSCCACIFSCYALNYNWWSLIFV